MEPGVLQFQSLGGLGAEGLGFVGFRGPVQGVGIERAQAFRDPSLRPKYILRMYMGAHIEFFGGLKLQVGGLRLQVSGSERR